MNLTPLFETQRKLDEHIIRGKGLEGQDLLPNTILALQVEIGECCNEWRGFKHWSNDREPRYADPECPHCKGSGVVGYTSGQTPETYDEHEAECTCRNPLLEEYVDCLHFILSIGLEIGVDMGYMVNVPYPGYQSENITKQFNFLIHSVSVLQFGEPTKQEYDIVLDRFLGLGGMLGFTWEQIEEAYYAKNKINHQRQETGY